MTPTPADLAAALDRTRGILSANIVDFENMPLECVADLFTLARWLAENAGRLRVVRGLEWENFFDDADAQYFAKTIFGMYRACRYEWSFQGKATRVNSLEEGKAACQADYDERLAAAISPAFPEVEGRK